MKTYPEMYVVRRSYWIDMVIIANKSYDEVMVQAPIKIQMHIFYIYSKVNKVNLSAHTLHLPLS